MIFRKNRHNKGRRTSTRQDKEAGYSLLEILVVLAIISLLATLVGPRLFNQLDKSKITAAKVQAKSIRQALDAYRLDTGRYPTQNEGLMVLINPPSGNDFGWAGPYMEGDLPKDPWGNDFVYQPAERDAQNRMLSPKVISYGADNKPGGTGNDADISSS